MRTETATRHVFTTGNVALPQPTGCCPLGVPRSGGYV